MSLPNYMIREFLEIGSLAGENSDAMDDLSNFIEIANYPNIGLHLIHNAHIDITQSTVKYTFDSGMIILFDADKGVSVHIGELDADITDSEKTGSDNYLCEFCKYSTNLINEHYLYVFMSI